MTGLRRGQRPGRRDHRRRRARTARRSATTDLALLVNGLWRAGAEAIAINGQRLTARSAIRNSGAAINVNGRPPLSPPYVVTAIGDTKTLQADLLDTSTGLAFQNGADALGFR